MAIDGSARKRPTLGGDPERLRLVGRKRELERVLELMRSRPPAPNRIGAARLRQEREVEAALDEVEAQLDD